MKICTALQGGRVTPRNCIVYRPTRKRLRSVSGGAKRGPDITSKTTTPPCLGDQAASGAVSSGMESCKTGTSLGLPEPSTASGNGGIKQLGY